MKIFGKHVFRSIKADPRQPIMIVLIVSLCVAVMILSVVLPANIYKNELEAMRADEWTADIEISLKGNSAHRLIYADDVARAIEGRGRVIGEFALTGFLSHGDGAERSQVNLGAFDLADASDFYSLQCVQGGNLTNTNIKSAAVIGEGFASLRGLSLGDTLKINILGEEFTYVVRAIVRDTGIMKRDDMLVDISSIRSALTARSPIIASLGSDFDPYTKVHIKLSDGIDPSALKNELENLPDFADKKVGLPADAAEEKHSAVLLCIAVLIPSVLLLIVAAMMTVSTFDLMQKKRGSDIALFRAAGADSGHLNMLLYLESSVYGLAGGIFGSALCIPLMRATNSLYHFKYSVLTFGFKEALLGLLFSLGFVALCTSLYIFKARKNRLSDGLKNVNVDTDSRILSKLLLFGVPAAIFTAVTLLLPNELKFVGAFLLLFITVAMIYAISPYVIGACAKLICRLLARKKRGAGDFILAAKSCAASYPLKHAGRIITVLASVFICMNFVLSAVSGELNSYTDVVDFEYAGVMADEKTEELVRSIEGVSAVAEVNVAPNVVFKGNQQSIGISVSGDVDGCLNGDLRPEKMPKGNEVAISKGLVRMLGIKLGDTVMCEISNIPCELILTEIVNASGDFVFYDADYLGVQYDVLSISTDGRQQTYESIVTLLDERGIECITKSEYFATASDRIRPQITVMRAMMYAMMLLTLVGIFNVLAEQRAARQSEFNILVQNGKTKRGIRILRTCEVAYLLVFALAMSVIFSQLLSLMVDTAGISFGLTLYS